MPRAAPRSQTFTPPPGGTLAALEASLLVLLTAAARHEPDAPSAIAFRSAMKSRVSDAFAPGGIEAARYLPTRICQADPAKADAREAIINGAWASPTGSDPRCLRRVALGHRRRGDMADHPIDTQAQRMPNGKPRSDGLANTPQDTQTGTVKPQDGPMDRPGTEAEEDAQRAKE